MQLCLSVPVYVSPLVTNTLLILCVWVRVCVCEHERQPVRQCVFNLTVGSGAAQVVARTRMTNEVFHQSSCSGKAEKKTNTSFELFVLFSISP